MFDHSRLGLKNKFFPNKIAQSPTTLILLIALYHSVGETIMDNWTSPKYYFMKHTIVLCCSQFTSCIPLSKRKAKIKKSGRSFCVSKKICVRQVYFTSKSWQQIWWCVNQPFKYTFYQCFYT